MSNPEHGSFENAMDEHYHEHRQEIAKEMYMMYAHCEKLDVFEITKYEDLPEIIRNAWFHTAKMVHKTYIIGG